MFKDRLNQKLKLIAEDLGIDLYSNIKNYNSTGFLTVYNIPETVEYTRMFQHLIAKSRLQAQHKVEATIFLTAKSRILQYIRYSFSKQLKHKDEAQIPTRRFTN